MARGPDFFRKMTQAQIDALEEFARHPGRSIDDIAGHLQDQGVQTSRSAVGRWVQDFRAWDESVRRTAFVRAYVGQDHDPVAMGETIARELDGQILDKLISGEPLTAKDLKELATARRAITADREALAEMRAKGREQMEQLKSAAKAKAITPEMIEQVSKAVFG
jgi:hypothetical protein